MTRHTFSTMVPPAKRASTFPAELARLLEERGLSSYDFARSIGYENNGIVDNVIAGRRPPPLDRVLEWLDALDLEAGEKMRLFRLAMRQFAPAYVVRILAQLDRCRDQGRQLVEALGQTTGVNFYELHKPEEQRKINEIMKGGGPRAELLKNILATFTPEKDFDEI